MVRDYLFGTSVRRCPNCFHYAETNLAGGCVGTVYDLRRYDNHNLKCVFCGMVFCRLCNSDMKDDSKCLHFCSRYPGYFVEFYSCTGFSVCSYVVWTMISILVLAPLIGFFSMLYPIVEILVWPCIDETVMVHQNLPQIARLFTIGRSQQLLDKYCCSDMRCLTYLLAIIIVVFIYIPLALTISILLAPLIFAVSTIYFWGLMVIYLLRVSWTVLAIWLD